MKRAILLLSVFAACGGTEIEAGATPSPKRIEFRRGLPPRRMATIAVCGNGIVEMGEACDDNNTTAGDGCSAMCTIESGWTCSGAGTTSCHPLSLEAMSAGNSNNFTCGEPNYLEGISQFTVEWSFRSTVTNNICGASLTPWFDVWTSNTNAIIRPGCFDDSVGDGEELRFPIYNGSTFINCDSAGLDLRGEEWTRLLVVVNLPTSVRVYRMSPGRRETQLLTCGTLPSATDSTSVTAVLELNPSGGFSSGALDDVKIWTGIPASDQVVWDYWGQARGFEGEIVSPANAGFGTLQTWLPIGDPPSDTTSAVEDVVGANDCTGSMPGGYVSTWLPVRSALNTERGAVNYRSFTISQGTERWLNTTNGQANSNYIGNPRVYRYARNKLRDVYGPGAGHAEPNYRIHYGNSLNNGLDWHVGNGAETRVNYPWTTETEAVVEPSQAPSCTPNSIEGGNRGPNCLPIQGQHDDQEGAYLCLWNLTCTGATNTVRPGGALVTAWHLDTPTWTEDRTAGTADVFFPVGAPANNVRHAIGGNGVELTNGDMIWSTYGHSDTGCSANQIRLWRSTGLHSDNASWTHQGLLINGCASTTWRPVEPSMFRAKMAPGDAATNVHNRVYLTVKADDITPTGASEPFDFTCIYSNNPQTDPSTDPITWTWRHCDDGTTYAGGTADLHWTYGEGSNHNVVSQLANGTFFIVGRETVGSLATSPNHTIFSTSADFGATWTLQGRVTEPNQATDPDFPRSGGADGFELYANHVATLATQERDNDITHTRYVFGEVSPTYIPSGPLTWSNNGWCEVNGDASETNEYLRWGSYPEMQGQARNQICFDFRDNDGSAQETLWWQRGAGGNGLGVSRLSSGAVRLQLSTYSCETAGSVLSTSANHELCIRYNGGTPALLIDIDGTNVVCNVNVSGTVPSTWTTSTERIRLGIDDAGANACTNCFFDEIAVWDGIVAVDAARGASCLGTDPRLCNIDDDADNDGTADSSDANDDNDDFPDSTDTDDDNDGILDGTDTGGITDTPLGYVRCEGENASLSSANGCAVSENWGYAPVWIHGQNTECTDTGVTP